MKTSFQNTISYADLGKNSCEDSCEVPAEDSCVVPARDSCGGTLRILIARVEDDSCADGEDCRDAVSDSEAASRDAGDVFMASSSDDAAFRYAGDASHHLPRKSASSTRVPRRKKESALSRKLAAVALEQYLGRKPSNEELASEKREPDGKPYFERFPDFHFNISHSGRFVVCGLSDHPIGIDLQKIPETPASALKIASHFFSSEEQKALQALASDASADQAAVCLLFTRCWTARESYIKLTGRGLAEPFSNFRPDLEAGEIAFPEVTGDPKAVGRYFLTELPAPEGFCLTVCCSVPLRPCEAELVGSL